MWWTEYAEKNERRNVVHEGNNDDESMESKQTGNTTSMRMSKKHGVQLNP